MANNHDLEGLLTAYIIGGTLFWQALKRHKKLRKIQDHPRSKISSAPQGLVEVEGFAWKKEKCIKDLTGQEVVYYHFEIQKEETRGSGRHKRKTWVTIYTKIFEDPFYIADPTGLALIVPLRPELHLVSSSPRQWSALNPLEREKVFELIGPHVISGFPPASGFIGLFSSRYRIIEKKIPVGSPLYVHGDFKTAGSGQPEKTKQQGLTDFSKKVFDLESRSLRNVRGILDKNGDGKVSEEEARTGYVAAARMALQAAIKPDNNESEFEVYGTFAPSEVHPLVVSDAHEAHTVERLASWQKLRFVGGATVLAFAVIATLIEFVGEKKLKQDWETPKVERVVAAEIEEKEPDIHKWHQDCLENKTDACQSLLANKDKFHLEKQNTDYYTYQLCKNGVREHCKK